MTLKNRFRTFFVFSLLSVSATACYTPTATTTPDTAVVVPNTTQSGTVTGNSITTATVSPIATGVPTTDSAGNIVFVTPSSSPFPSSVYATASSQATTSVTPLPTATVYSTSAPLNSNTSGTSILQPTPVPTSSPVPTSTSAF